MRMSELEVSLDVLIQSRNMLQTEEINSEVPSDISNMCGLG